MKKQDKIKQNKETIQTHIGKAEFDEAFALLKTFIELFTDDDEDLSDQLTVISARYHNNSKANILGIINDNTELNQVTNSISKILREANKKAIALAETNSKNEESWFGKFSAIAGSATKFLDVESLAENLDENNIKQIWGYLTPKIRSIILEKYITKIQSQNLMTRTQLIEVFDLDENSLLFIETNGA